jgi:hypothetical protein
MLFLFLHSWYYTYFENNLFENVNYIKFIEVKKEVNINIYWNYFIKNKSKWDKLINIL